MATTLFVYFLIFRIKYKLDTGPTVIHGKATNQTNLTDDNTPMETQNAQCTIKAGNIEASAQASVSKKLEGICGTSRFIYQLINQSINLSI